MWVHILVKLNTALLAVKIKNAVDLISVCHLRDVQKAINSWERIKTKLLLLTITGKYDVDHYRKDDVTWGRITAASGSYTVVSAFLSNNKALTRSPMCINKLEPDVRPSGEPRSFMIRLWGGWWVGWGWIVGVGGVSNDTWDNANVYFHGCTHVLIVWRFLDGN